MVLPFAWWSIDETSVPATDLYQSISDQIALSAVISLERDKEFNTSVAISIIDSLALSTTSRITPPKNMSDGITLSASTSLARERVIATSVAISITDSLTLSTESALPAAPSGLGATGNVTDPTQVDLTWTDNSDDEDNFHLQRRLATGPGSWGDISTSIAANATSYTDTTSAGDTIYDYRIRSTNTRGASATWSNVANIDTGEE